MSEPAYEMPPLPEIGNLIPEEMQREIRKMMIAYAQACVEAAQSPDVQRYHWLREGKSKNLGYCGSAPFVMNPRRSRLYAIARFQQEALDIAVDEDIIDNKVHDLEVCNYLVENEILKWPVDRMSDEYANALYKEAARQLGWSAERLAKVESLYKEPR